MADRLTPLDVSFLYLEEAPAAMHVGSVMIFEAPDGGVDIDRLREHVLASIAFVPRYRQRVRVVPGRVGNPVWVDAEEFEITDHITQVTLPSPGSEGQLAELVADFQAAALDRSKPLWDMLIIDGLRHNRFAVVTKVHQAMVDGINAVDLGQVVLDDDDEPSDSPVVVWRPAPEPSDAELLAAAVIESIGRPTRILETLNSGLTDVQASARKALRAIGGLALAARTATNPPPRSSLNAELGDLRRFAMVTSDLEDYRLIRRSLSDSATDGAPIATVNDIVLGVIAGALRNWLMSRGEGVGPTSLVRALVPISIELPHGVRPGAVGSRVSSLLIDLPVGEPSALMRVYQVSYQTKAHRENGQAVDARRIADVAGFAPPTLHSLGARVASGLSRRLFNLVITNVPGPQTPLYLDGNRMVASFPVMPLALGQALSVGVTSYHGKVHVGLFGDRDAMADLDVLAQCLSESLAETLDAASRRADDVALNRRLAGLAAAESDDPAPDTLVGNAAVEATVSAPSKSATSKPTASKTATKRATSKSAAVKAAPRKQTTRKPPARKRKDRAQGDKP